MFKQASDLVGFSVFFAHWRRENDDRSRRKWQTRQRLFPENTHVATRAFGVPTATVCRNCLPSREGEGRLLARECCTSRDISAHPVHVHKRPRHRAHRRTKTALPGAW